MGIRDRLKSLLGGRRHEVPTEDDVRPDPGTANSRATGGGASTDADASTTTGSGSSGEFVGRASADDLGAAGETGAEARAQEESGPGD